MIYIVTFAATTFLVYLSGKCAGSLRVLLAAIGLSLPCVLAGVRDETVGTDVLSYAKWMCVSAQSTSFFEFLRYEADTAAIGWNVMTWLSVRAFGGMVGYLFVIEALCIIPVFLAANRLFENREWIVVLIWLLLWYALSLNGMRQSVAMSFIVYSVVYVVKRRPVLFSMCVIAGSLFHQTAIVGLLLYPFAMVVVYGRGMNKMFGSKKIIVLVLSLIIIFSLLISAGPTLVTWLSVFKDSYSYQVDHLGAKDVSIEGLYLMISMLAVWLNAKNGVAEAEEKGLRRFTDCGKTSSRDTLATFHFVCAAATVGSLFWQLNYVAATLGRLGYYGSVLIPICGGLLLLCGKYTRSSLSVLIILCTVYFVVFTMILGHSSVYPYTSIILGI